MVWFSAPGSLVRRQTPKGSCPALIVADFRPRLSTLTFPGLLTSLAVVTQACFLTADLVTTVSLSPAMFFNRHPAKFLSRAALQFWLWVCSQARFDVGI